MIRSPDRNLEYYRVRAVFLYVSLLFSFVQSMKNTLCRQLIRALRRGVKNLRHRKHLNSGFASAARMEIEEQI
jgi:hypothetical protein